MNEENSYNLIDEPWIPVLMRDGTNRSVSLGAVFADTDGTIADFALNPYERVAVFRLLLCIAQAAFGPERLKDEAGWLAAKDAVGPVSADYLKKWHDRFFLYGPHAFLQPDDAKPIKGKDGRQSDFNSDVSKLCLARASGNNSTLFDHAASTPNRGMSDAGRILNLLVFQSFSSGGRFSQCLWDGAESPANGSAFSAPCRESDILFSILIGSDVIETVWLNLLTRDKLDSAKIKFGVPIWEFEEITRSVTNDAAWSYLGHLLPISRIVKLSPDKSGMTLGEGVIYPTLNPDPKNPEKRPFGWREPMATVKPNGEEPPDYVSSNPTRMPWRDLTSILAVHANGRAQSAMALSHRESLPDEKEFVIWMGGLCTNQAKDIGVVDWTARLSTAWLEQPIIQRYQSAIDHAERQCGHMISAAITYSELLKMTKVKKGKKEVHRPADVAESIYWDILAQGDNQRLVQDVESHDYFPKWKEAAFTAAREAYRRACPAMTARQMEAFAQGFAKLHAREEANHE